MDKRLVADQIIETGALFMGPWALERVGHEQWVFRGTKDDLQPLFKLLGQLEPFVGKSEVQVAPDMRLVLHESVEHVQLRIYDKERMETLLGREVRRLNVTPESIKKVGEWLAEAKKSGIDQLSYLNETMDVFGQEGK